MSERARPIPASRWVLVRTRWPAMNWQNPPQPWGELERKLSGRAKRDFSANNPLADSAPGFSRKRPHYDRRRASGPPAGRPDRAVRRAALPQQLQLPRRGQRPRGADRGSGPARAGRHRHHRSRRLLRRVPVRRGRAGVRPADHLRRRAVPRPEPPRRTGSPIPRASTCWSWPAGSRATTGWPGRSPRLSCGGTRRAGRSTTWRSWPPQAGDQWLIMTGCRKGHVRHALTDPGVESRRRRAGSADRAVRPRSRGGRADRSRPAGRFGGQRRAGRAGPRPRSAAGGQQQRALRLPEREAAGRCGGRGPGPAQPGRHGRLAARSGRPSAVRGRDGPAVRPVPRVRWPAVVEIADDCAFNLRLAKPRLPKMRVPLGHTPNSWLRELCRTGRDERYPDRREVGRRPGWTRSCRSSRRRASAATS